MSEVYRPAVRNVRCVICGSQTWKVENYQKIMVRGKLRLVHRTCLEGAHRSIAIELQDENEMLKVEVLNLKKELESKPCAYSKIGDSKPAEYGEYLVKLNNGRSDICIYRPWSGTWVDKLGHDRDVSSWMEIP
jgi:hypothetical protein